MGRIRTIKPEFPHSESIGKLSRDARLLFIELWTIVDDSGRTRAASRMLASLLFPYDDDAPGLIEGWLVELETFGHIHRYQHEGCSYLQVCNFLIHQKIDKPSASKNPSPDGNSPNPREGSRKIVQDQGGDQGKDQGGEGKKLRPVGLDPGSEIGIAVWLFQELGIPSDFGTRNVAAQAIQMLAKERDWNLQEAAEFMLVAARSAKKKSETINRFWFTDQKYIPKKKPDSFDDMKFINVASK